MYSVRRCNANDYANWAQLRHALWPKGSVEEHAADIAMSETDVMLRGYLALTDGEEAVGFAEISIRHYANGATRSPVPFLEGIWIAPDHRCRRVGRMLIDRIAADCAAEGFVELCSDAAIDNNGSQLAHEGWGFVETERVVYFRKPI